MGVLKTISGIIDWISERLGRTVMWLTLLVVLVGAINAILRYAGKGLGWELSSNAFIEAQWYLFAIIFLLGAAYTLRHNAHVRVDVIYDRLSPRAQSWINLVGHLVLLVPFCIFMLWVSFPRMINSWQQWEVSPDPGGLPRYPIVTVLPLAFVFLLLQGVSEILKTIRKLVTGDFESEPEEPQHHES